MPSSKRPPLITSIIEHSLAVRPGFRNDVQTTMWPSRTRFVAIASAARVENDSKVISSVGSGTVVKWSKTQSDSNPSASAFCASSIVRVHAAAASHPSYSPFQPWAAIMPTCIELSLYVRRTCAGLATVVVLSVSRSDIGRANARIPAAGRAFATTAEPHSLRPGSVGSRTWYRPVHDRQARPVRCRWDWVEGAVLPAAGKSAAGTARGRRYRRPHPGLGRAIGQAVGRARLQIP